MRKCSANHVGRGAIFHASAGIEPLRLGKQADAFQVANQSVQTKKRRIADSLVHRRAEL